MISEIDRIFVLSEMIIHAQSTDHKRLGFSANFPPILARYFFHQREMKLLNKPVAQFAGRGVDSFIRKKKGCTKQ